MQGRRRLLVMDLGELGALIDLCRSKGVSALELEGVKLVLGAAPVEPGRAEPAPKRQLTPEEATDVKLFRPLGIR